MRGAAAFQLAALTPVSTAALQSLVRGVLFRFSKIFFLFLRE